MTMTEFYRLLNQAHPDAAPKWTRQGAEWNDSNPGMDNGMPEEEPVWWDKCPECHMERPADQAYCLNCNKVTEHPENPEWQDIPEDEHGNPVEMCTQCKHTKQIGEPCEYCGHYDWNPRQASRWEPGQELPTDISWLRNSAVTCPECGTEDCQAHWHDEDVQMPAEPKTAGEGPEDETYWLSDQGRPQQYGEGYEVPPSTEMGRRHFGGWEDDEYDPADAQDARDNAAWEEQERKRKQEELMGELGPIQEQMAELMRSRGMNEPDWEPLKSIIPEPYLRDWMWMGYGPGGLREYKHSDTRRYLHLLPGEEATTSHPDYGVHFRSALPGGEKFVNGRNEWGEQVAAFQGYSHPRDPYGPITYRPINLGHAIDRAYEDVDQLGGTHPFRDPPDTPRPNTAAINYQRTCPACGTGLMWKGNESVQLPDDAGRPMYEGTDVPLPRTKYPIHECPNCSWPHREIRRLQGNTGTRPIEPPDGDAPHALDLYYWLKSHGGDPSNASPSYAVDDPVPTPDPEPGAYTSASIDMGDMPEGAPAGFGPVRTTPDPETLDPFAPRGRTPRENIWWEIGKAVEEGDIARAQALYRQLPPGLRPPSLSAARTFYASARVPVGWPFSPGQTVEHTMLGIKGEVQAVDVPGNRALVHYQGKPYAIVQPADRLALADVPSPDAQARLF
ncbi:hypothetical protein [Candidatus Solirubrobacter pratensis]|uniref:hypothetical protein n=1 Tax=Candidatus Solirubrobacter pratensis TaxID=1298857 RepID=UPI0004826EE7|nr:hypothetical protein [Candidatus Solirubrobacter pratensis]